MGAWQNAPVVTTPNGGRGTGTSVKGNLTGVTPLTEAEQNIREAQAAAASRPAIAPGSEAAQNIAASRIPAGSEAAQNVAEAQGQNNPNAYKGLTYVGHGQYLATPAAKAFMAAEAELSKMGISLWINSGFRSIEEQEQLYNEYREGKRAGPVGLPGHSLHQRGIAADIGYSGDTAKVKAVLKAHGFDQSDFIRRTDPLHFTFGIVDGEDPGKFPLIHGGPITGTEGIDQPTNATGIPQGGGVPASQGSVATQGSVAGAAAPQAASFASFAHTGASQDELNSIFGKNSPGELSDQDFKSVGSRFAMDPQEVASAYSVYRVMSNGQAGDVKDFENWLFNSHPMMRA